MSRSRRKNPCIFNSRISNAGDKKIANKKYRKIVKMKISQKTYDDFPIFREISNVSDFVKEGNGYHYRDSGLYEMKEGTWEKGRQIRMRK